ncbi:MAG: ATP-binding protein [Chloroflexota bacterium]
MKRLLEPIQTRISTTRLVWKLMASYLIVIFVGLATLALAAESVAPTAFDRHMMGMQHMMTGDGGLQPGQGMQFLQTQLFDNFRAALGEALFWAGATALASAVVVSVFVSRRVVTPIRQMMTASRTIAAGHYRQRVEVTSEDELGQLARSFNQMAATLEQTEALRRELIANVAHELRTPLSSIKGYMEGLIDGVLPAQPDTYQQVYREADRLQRLVNDLQELSRVEAGAFELERRPLALADLVRQIAARLRPQFEEKGVCLALDLPDNLPPVLADEDRISQVLLNLVGNALQYTPCGGSVTVTLAAPDSTQLQTNGQPGRISQLLITIGDTGLGIPPEHLPHLFTRFYRVDKSRSRAGGGSGIGLTIARHLVEAHGGHIWAESEGEGRGSTFGFTLPLA